MAFSVTQEQLDQVPRWLAISYDLWDRRIEYRKDRVLAYRARADREIKTHGVVTNGTRWRLAMWTRRYEFAKRMKAKRIRQIRRLTSTPTRTVRIAHQRVYQSGPPIFGRLGEVIYRTFHHSAGPVDKSDSHAKRMNEQYSRQHSAQGWRLIGYHGNVTRSGLIILFQDMGRKGAHVGGHNSNNQGFMLHGNFDHVEPSKEQLESIELINSGKLAKYGIPKARVRGHNSWAGHGSNVCPGRNLKKVL